MKTKLLVSGILMATAALLPAATNDLSTALQKGLFEEEANHNLSAAIQAYQSVVSQLDEARNLAATAVFRLGECYRKQGKTNEAIAQFERILRDFSDQPALVMPSRETLMALGGTAAPSSNTSEKLEAERLALDSQIAELKSLSKDKEKLRIKVQQNFSNPVLDSLMQKLAEAEQKLVAIKLDFGPEHAETRKGTGLVETIGKQIDAQVEAVMTGLEIKRNAMAKSARPLQAEPASGTDSIESDQVKQIQEMIKNSPDLINARNEQGWAPLHTAANQGQTVVARFLLANGADIEAKTGYDGATPLHLAAINGHRAMVDLLLSQKADVQATDNNGVTALHSAARKGFKSVMELLLDHHAEVNDRDHSEETPLHYAAASGNKTIIELLIAHQADVNAKNQKGATPLINAITQKQLAAARILIANKAELNFFCSATMDRLREGYYPVHFAVLSKNDDILELVLKNGSDPNVKNTAADAPLHLAANMNRKGAAQLLLAYKADPNLKNGSHDTPLLLAIKNGSKEIAELLLAHHADPNQKDQSDKSPLYLAVEGGRKDLVELLLASKADANAPDRNGFTPLHLAVARRQLEIAELLLAIGVDVNARNNEGKTPLNYATEQASRVIASQDKSAWDQIIQLLRQHGAVDEFLDLSSIRITRKGVVPSIIFRKDTNSLNHFTLLEAIGNYFVYDPRTFPARPPQALPFPDFSKIKIQRGASPKSGGEKEFSVNLLTATNTLDCTKDVWLEFGDIIEVPERDHTLAEPAVGLTESQSNELNKCLKRTVTFVIKGQPTQITLWGVFGSSDIAGALKLDDVKRILRSSSDLSRLELKRTDPVTKKSLKLSVEPKPGPNDLWLRDGDVIEVPDKS